MSIVNLNVDSKLRNYLRLDEILKNYIRKIVFTKRNLLVLLRWTHLFVYFNRKHFRLVYTSGDLRLGHQISVKPAVLLPLPPLYL